MIGPEVFSVSDVAGIEGWYMKNYDDVFSTVALCCILLGFYQISGSPIVTGQIDDASEEEEGDFISPVVPATVVVVAAQDNSGFLALLEVHDIISTLPPSEISSIQKTNVNPNSVAAARQNN